MGLADDGRSLEMAMLTSRRSPSVDGMRRVLLAIRAAMRDHPWSFDIGFGLIILICGIFATALSIGPATALGIEFHAAGSYLVAVAIGVAISLRNLWPLTTLILVSVMYSVGSFHHATEGVFSTVAVFIAFYTAGAVGRRPHAHWVRAASILLLAVLLGWAVLTEMPEENLDDAALLSTQLLLVFLNTFYLAVAWVMGEQMHGRRQREHRLQAQADELAEAHQAIARHAVGVERMRIARELHDVVAHHVSMMGIQAGAARKVLDRCPEQASAALAAIESSSRDAVNELQNLLGFLRQEGDLDTTAPPPTLEAVPILIEQVRQAGVSIDLRYDGVDAGLSSGLDLSAYRVIQEALTNVVKHSGPGTRAAVTVVQSPSSLDVIVFDDGGGVPVSGPVLASPGGADRNGNGLLGMQERVALHGGTLDTGPTIGGGYEVRATFARRHDDETAA